MSRDPIGRMDRTLFAGLDRMVATEGLRPYELAAFEAIARRMDAIRARADASRKISFGSL